jgi:DNA-binding PadR family transcriptional regulator
VEGGVISAPKGILRLAALRMLSESSLSGVELARQVASATNGAWSPGPGSIYLMLSELNKKGLVTELPRRGGTIRRYIISSKGKEELGKLSRRADSDVVRQLKLLSAFSGFAGRESLARRLAELASAPGSGPAKG